MACMAPPAYEMLSKNRRKAGSKMQRPQSLQGRTFPSWPNMSFPWVLGVLVVGLCLCSCSKTARARRHLSRAKETYGQSRSLLLEGKVEEAQKLANRSIIHAETSMELLPSETFRDAVQKQLFRSRMLSSYFDDPAFAVQLWIEAIREEDTPLASFLYDCPRTLEVVFSEDRGTFSEEEWSRLEQTVRASYARTIERFQDALLSLQADQMKTVSLPEGASVHCSFQFLDDKVDFACWLHQDAGAWKIYDFSLETDRATEVFKKLVPRIDKEADMAVFFEGKGIFEAFSDVQDAEKFGLLFHKKPLIGQYVRLRKPVHLNRSGRKQRIEKERILKVFDQGKNSSGKDVLRVRTTEAVPSKSAMGEIPLEAVEVLGNDEDLLWGVSS